MQSLVRGLGANRDGTRLASHDTDGHAQQVQLWRDGEETHAPGKIAGHGETYRQAWFDLAGRYLCLGGEAGKARLHDVATRDPG